MKMLSALRLRFGNVLFDLDGTLTDSKPAITKCIRHVLSVLAVPLPSAAELDWCVGPPLWEVFGRLLRTTETPLIERAVDLYLAQYEMEGPELTIVFPGVVPLLAALEKCGSRIFLATAKEENHGEKVLSHFGLRTFFAASYGTRRDGSIRTKSQLIRFILETENLAAASTAMVGDREHDIRAARENGITPIGVSYGYGSRQELLNAGAGLVFEDLETLGAFLLPPD